MGHCPGCRNSRRPAGHSHLQAVVRAGAVRSPIMGPVHDRDGWQPRGAHKTCRREGRGESGQLSGCQSSDLRRKKILDAFSHFRELKAIESSHPLTEL